MNTALTRYVPASSQNTTSVPNASTTGPPAAAPTASITDHVAARSALAVSNSPRFVIDGRTASRAGVNAALTAICAAAST